MAIGSPQWMYASGEAYELEQSLKFNDGDSAYLSWTPSSAGNRRTYTWSGWVKRGELGSNNTIFGAGNGGTIFDELRFGSDDKLDFYTYASATYGQRKSTAVFRDASAWYHIIAVYDSTDSTALNRMKLYVNGQQITDLATTTNPDQNHQGNINNNIIHAVGAVYAGQLYNPYDGYLAEVNFIDGQALTPADFGETGDYGEWKPIEYSGTYGTNGFYLPFKQDYTVEGFSTVTYKGTGASQYIGGVGFQSDLTWTKVRTAGSAHALFDSVRGVNKALYSNLTTAEETSSSFLQSFSNDGFDPNSNGSTGASGESYVAWNWDMGGTTSTDHTQSNLTSVYRANTTYGQSVVTYTGDGAAGQGFAHGLGASPHFWMIKNRTDASDWYVYHQSLGNTKALNLNSDAAAATSAAWANYGPVSNAITVNGAGGTNTSGKNYVAYVFEEKTGYSKFGTYVGNGGSNAITTGFELAFLVIKRSTGGTGGWMMYDNVRGVSKQLQANASAAEDTVAGKISFQSTGFTCLINHTETNSNGDNYIYMAFADKREYAYWLDQSGNNNDWTSNNLTESDISVDSPTNNFATLNPLDKDGDVTVSEGNLKALHNGTQHDAIRSSFGKSTGKWYYEALVPTAESYIHLGLANTEWSVYGNVYDSSLNWTFQSNGSTNNGSNTNTGISALSAGDIVQVAYDLDAGKIWWGVNNTWILSGNPSTAANPVYSNLSGTLAPVGSFYQAENGATFNFGQDSSFAGNKTSQAKQDSNDIGDFFYEPPNGFLALCSKSLPEPTVIPSEHFDAILYTGTGSEHEISLLNFQPDLAWIKERPNVSNHYLYDSVRGATKVVYSDGTYAEQTDAQSLKSFDSDGYTLGTNTGVNQSSTAYVAWNWKANGTGSSNTDGSITSTVSANVDSGFSIVGWTGNATAGATVGHGLSKSPEMIILKDRDGTTNWSVYHASNTAAPETDALALNTTDATSDYLWWNDTAPTSSVFSLGAISNTNANGNDFIAYCFHSVDGYSAVGSFSGNSNADGTFVHTSFAPSFIMVKRTDSTGHWEIHDTKRDAINQSQMARLFPNYSNAESNDDGWDILSNGFKLRTTHSSTNAGTIIYIAFAETPFKYSNAR